MSVASTFESLTASAMRAASVKSTCCRTNTTSFVDSRSICGMPSSHSLHMADISVTAAVSTWRAKTSLMSAQPSQPPGIVVGPVTAAPPPVPAVPR